MLALERASTIPEIVLVKKFFRLRSANVQVIGTAATTDEMGDRRRDHLVRVSSYVRRAAARGRPPVRVLVNVYGAVHHFAVVLIDGTPGAYAFIECIKSGADGQGSFGLAEKRRDTECFTSMGGSMLFVNVSSIDSAVGTLFVRGSHIVLYTREILSTE